MQTRNNMKKLLLILTILPCLAIGQVMKYNATYNLGKYWFNGNGSTNYIDFGTNTETSFVGVYSLFFTLKTTDAGTKNILSNRRTSGNLDGIDIIIGGGEIAAQYDNGASLTSLVTVGANIADGNKHIIFITYDGTNTTIYKDGGQIATGTPAKTFTLYSRLIVCTSANLTAIRFLNGEIGDLRVYNQSFLPAVIDNYTPIFYSPMSEASYDFATFYDVSGNGNHGTASGTSYRTTCTGNDYNEIYGCTYVTYGNNTVLVPYLLAGTELYTSVDPVLNAAEKTREFPASYWLTDYFITTASKILKQ